MDGRPTKKATRITALLTIPSGFIVSETAQALVQTGLEELEETSGTIPFESGIGSTHYPKIQWIANPSKTIRKLFSPYSLGRFEILKITSKIPFSGKEIEIPESAGAVKPKDVDELCRLVLCEIFREQVFNLIVAANLSRMGSIGVEYSLILQDGEENEPRSGILKVDSESLLEAVELIVRLGWPELGHVPVLDAWNWLTQFEDFAGDVFSSSQIGRALGALTRAIEPSVFEDPSRLFWALMGVEALYVHGNAAILEQVREKTKVVLGTPTAFKKRVNKMYDFRSRFVHGNLDFPNLVRSGSSFDSPFDKALVESTSLALAILISTLQQLIKTNSKELKFGYSQL